MIMNQKLVNQLYKIENLKNSFLLFKKEQEWVNCLILIKINKI